MRAGLESTIDYFKEISFASGTDAHDVLPEVQMERSQG